MRLRPSVVLAAAGSSSTPAAAGRLLPRLGHMLQLGVSTPPALPAQTFEMPIDHFGDTLGTYRNRWFYNDTYYQQGGPVILFDAGAHDASMFVDYLLEPDGYKTAVMQLARQYQGLALLWEHRYYGESNPFAHGAPPDPSSTFNLGDMFTSEQISLLTVDQAIQDVATFASNFALPADAAAVSRLSAPDSLRPQKTPWIFVGGRYSGARAAIMRVHSPDVIYASWASSAPVQAMADGYAWYDSIRAALPANCSADLVAAVQYMDAMLGSAVPSDVLAVKKQALAAFGYPTDSATLDDWGPSDIASWLASPFELFPDGGPATVMPFCDSVETSFGRNSPSTAGIAAAHSPADTFETVVNAAAMWLNTTLDKLQPFNSSTITYYASGMSVNDGVSGLLYSFQSCSEIGYLNDADPNANQSIVSKFLTLADAERICNTSSPGMVPSSPAVDHVNKYGGWHMAPSHTFFSAGEYDPWRSFQVASAIAGSPMRQASSTVPSAGTSPVNGTYYGVVYPGQSSTADMYSSSDDQYGKNAAFELGIGDAQAVWNLVIGRLWCFLYERHLESCPQPSSPVTSMYLFD